METIANAVERLETVVKQRPDFGATTAISATQLTEGLRCSTTEGQWVTESDLSPALGGTAAAPTPGMLMRAALGSCMAMSYRLRAARHRVELSAVRVTVETDSELIGMLLCDVEVPPGFTALRLLVEVDSPAPKKDVLRVLDEGDQLSPLLDVLGRRLAVERSTLIRGREN